MEPSPDIPAVPAAQALPGTLGSLRPPALNLGLFALTAASALFAGTTLDAPSDDPWRDLGKAAAFAVSLLAILLAHEFGHFFAARRHGMDASWPLFLPAPFISFLGTLGAVIRLRELPRSRKALVDVAAAGPLLGFLVTVPVLLVGIALSTQVTSPGAVVQWNLADALRERFDTGSWPPLIDAIEFGEPLVFRLLSRALHGDLASLGLDLRLHPIAIAGWFGLLLTALNLLPLGQLDGGHLLYALSARLHARTGPVLSAGLLALGLFTPFTAWALWGVLTGTVLSRHPPLSDDAAGEELSTASLLVIGLCALVFLLCLSITPIALVVGE